MKATALTLAMCGLCVAQSFASHSVSGYTRRDATYVRPHTSRDPGEGSYRQQNRAVATVARTSGIAPSYSTPRPSTSDNPMVPILFFSTLAGLGVWAASKFKTIRAKPASLPTMERQAAETIAFFQEVNRKRGFEPIPVNDLQLSTDEACVFTGDARLRQMRPHRYSVGGSVRVMRGVYVGQRQYESTESFDVIDQGVLYVTNKRIIFTGVKSTLNAPFNKLVSLDMHRDGLFVHSAGRQKASFIEFSGPLLVTMIVKYFQANDNAVRLHDNERVVAYYDEKNQKLTVGRRNGTEQPLALPTSQDEGQAPMLSNGNEAKAVEPDPQPEVANFYVFPNDEVEGPFSMEQLQALLQANKITPATPCCEGGAESWETVADYVAVPT